MSEHVWIVRSPEGKAIGSGIVASGAIRDTQAHCGSTTYGIMQRMFGHVHSGMEDSYEQDGYTLTREPLTPNDGTSSTGATGTPTPASAPRGEVSDRVAVDAFGRLVDALGVITDRLTEAVERKPASVSRGDVVAWVLWDEEGVIDSTFDKDSAEKWEKESSQIMRVRPLVFGDIHLYENQPGPTWRPMNTAPLDNRRPLVIATFEEDGSIRDIDFDAIWTSESESWEMPEVYWFWATAHGRIEDPTHWTYQDEPLPLLSIPVPEVAPDVV